jgi:hypothetical protein
MLTQRGMLTSPAFTSTRKRTRSNCARAISQKRIAATSDAGLFISAFCHEWGATLTKQGYSALLSHSPQRIGSLNVKVEPTPTWLVTQIRPPCSSTNFRERARPSPVPSTFFSAVPTWRNSSKMAS